MNSLKKIINNYIQKSKKVFDYYFFASRNIIIEPTNVCNLSCPICYKSISQIDKIQNGFMDISLFEDILSKIKGLITTIHLYFRGECFLHPHIVDFIKLCKLYHYNVCISTNGLLLKEELIKQLIEASLDHIIINYDAISQKDFALIRGDSHEAQIYDNIILFNTIKKELKKDTPLITVKSLNMRYSNTEIHNFIKALEKAGHRGTVCISDYFPWPDMKILSQFKLRFFPKPHICGMYYQGLTVTYNGTILPCSYDYQEKYTLGNIKEYRSLREVYRSQQYRDFRRRLLFKQYQSTAPCNTCLVPLAAFFEQYHSIGHVQGKNIPGKASVNAHA